MTYGWNALLILKISSPRTHVRHLREKHKNAIIEAVDDAEKLQVRINFKNHLQMTTREKTGLPRSRGRFRHKALKHYERIWSMLQVVHNSAIYFFFSKFISLITQDKWLLHFLVPRKFHLFGVRVDGISRQYYFVDGN